jgi:hypothetical protein
MSGMALLIAGAAVLLPRSADAVSSNAVSSNKMCACVLNEQKERVPICMVLYLPQCSDDDCAGHCD